MPFARLDDAALARRSVHGFCETIAALGGCGPGMEEVRMLNAVGAKAVDRSAPLASNHFFDAVVVPYDRAPPGVRTCHYTALTACWWCGCCCRRASAAEPLQWICCSDLL